jgi:hypothetical protein
MMICVKNYHGVELVENATRYQLGLCGQSQQQNMKIITHYSHWEAPFGNIVSY